MKKIYYFTLSIGLMSCTAAAQDNNPLIDQLKSCQKEASPLIRLDCYDMAVTKTLQPQSVDNNTNLLSVIPKLIRAKSVLLALEQEKTRAQATTDFIITTTNEESNNPTIVITTPAIGVKPPRPILAFSCIDNITRMQIIFSHPLISQQSRVKLKTEKVEFNTIWFIRDDGYTLEASRGLPGIEEIQKLFQANTLSFTSTNNMVNKLSFNIQDLAQTIKPLRETCRW